MNEHPSRSPDPWEDESIPEDIPAQRIYERAITKGMQQRSRRRRLRIGAILAASAIGVVGAVAIATTDHSSRNPNVSARPRTPRPRTAPPSPTSNPPALIGDITHDGRVNCADVRILRHEQAKRGPDLPADLNHDGKVNHRDLQLIAAHWTGPPRAPNACRSDAQ